MDEAAEIGLELKYTVPETGSVVWFDGWVIPKYAKNPKAASYFINFLCKPENVIRNMDAIGYVSTVGGQEILEGVEDPESFEPINASYFFGEEADSVCVNPTMYPDKVIITRCRMMHDGDTEQLLKMWSRVKGANASAWTYFIIFLFFGSLIFAVVFKYAKKRQRNRRSAKKRKNRKN
jgi:spermidine/putrescine transport system substrate-binding protein